jgi:hypothetical protein
MDGQAAERPPPTLETSVQREKNPLMWRRVQMEVLRETGVTQPEIADVTGVSLSTVNRAHMADDRGGQEALKAERARKSEYDGRAGGSLARPLR